MNARVGTIGQACRERGQAATEFLVVLLVLIPMFFGVYYLARYSDVKHSAIQASRYVAFERALDPYAKAKTPAQLAQETRTRFFVQKPANEQPIVYRDAPVNYEREKHRVPLWSDVSYQPLLQDFNQIVITEREVAPLATGVVGLLQNSVASPVFGLPTTGIVKAEVTVPLAEITHFDALRGMQIAMPGAVAIGAGSWSANGAKGSDESACKRVQNSMWVQLNIIRPVMSIIGVVMSPFESNTPDVGRVLPDYVPPGSVRNSNDGNVDLSQQNGNKC